MYKKLFEYILHIHGTRKTDLKYLCNLIALEVREKLDHMLLIFVL